MSNLTNDKDPFTPENAQAWTLVMAMRNYDVPMGILTVLGESYNDGQPPHKKLSISDTIYEAHQAGGLVSEPPKFAMPTAPEEEAEADG